jgi:superfamily II DNA helicase RecQ
MPFKIFTVPIQGAEEAERELNAFLRGHKVVGVDRRWVEQGAFSFWNFCVDFLDGAAHTSADGRPVGTRGKVDYKEVLKPEEFTVFARLREVRKEISQVEAVPVYTLFTNEQLAKMVQTRATSKADLEKIAGVGNARVEKYGGKLLEVLSGAWKQSDETNRPPA